MTRAETQRALFDAVVAAAVAVFDQTNERKVIDNRFFVDSEHDLNNLCIINLFTGGTEAKYVLIESSGTEDIDNGLDDCPRFFCNFTFHFFDQAQDKRFADDRVTTDGTNSTLDHAADVEKFRQAFLPRRLFGEDTFNERTTIRIDTQHNQVDPISRVVGSYTDLGLRVEKECDCA